MQMTRSTILAWLVVGACATSTAYQGPAAPPPSGNGGGAPLAPGELPPHKFTAREHVPRDHFKPEPASFTVLPKMERSTTCVPAGAVPEGRPRKFTPGQATVASAQVKNPKA